MRFKIIFLVFFLFLIRVQASSYIDSSTILNTSISNSSITFSLNTTLDYLEIQPTFIYLVNTTTSLGFCPEVNWSTNNANLDSSEFCASGGLLPFGLSGGGIIKTAGTLVKKAVFWGFLFAIILIILLVVLLNKKKKIVLLQVLNKDYHNT